MFIILLLTLLYGAIKSKEHRLHFVIMILIALGVFSWVNFKPSYEIPEQRILLTKTIHDIEAETINDIYEPANTYLRSETVYNLDLCSLSMLQTSASVKVTANDENLAGTAMKYKCNEKVSIFIYYYDNSTIEIEINNYGSLIYGVDSKSVIRLIGNNEIFGQYLLKNTHDSFNTKFFLSNEAQFKNLTDTSKLVFSKDILSKGVRIAELVSTDYSEGNAEIESQEVVGLYYIDEE